MTDSAEQPPRAGRAARSSRRGQSDVPYDYVADHRRHIVYVRAHRTLMARDVYGLLDQQIQQGMWHYGLLYDLRLNDAPTALNHSEAIAERVAVLVAIHGRRGPVAFVTGGASMDEVRALHARLSGEVFEVQSFTRFDNAKAWLGARMRQRTLVERGWSDGGQGGGVHGKLTPRPCTSP